MVKPIYVYGTQVLRNVAEKIDKDYPKLDELIANMYETMYASDGVGLAAPQIGKSIRLFVVDTSPFEDEDETLANYKKVFINAEIIEEKGDFWVFNEGCLSVPGIREDVSRKSIIKIKYLDENFVEHIDTIDGIRARVIQHEYDHLQGILFTDHLSPLKKKLLNGKINGITKGKMDVKYKVRIN